MSTSDDLLADVRHVWPDFEDDQYSQILLWRLGLYRPDRYGGWDADRLHTELRALGVKPTILRRRTSGSRRRTRLPGLRWTALPGTPAGQRCKRPDQQLGPATPRR
jgi:hypothetical protein